VIYVLALVTFTGGMFGKVGTHRVREAFISTDQVADIQVCAAPHLGMTQLMYKYRLNRRLTATPPLLPSQAKPRLYGTYYPSI